ncbi:glutamine amidotransferase class-II [Thermomonospora curvata DSM 43183]|uniref:Glutamine amidotransferase class-II n=2 Tax=Thermomonospora curvata TaxID=2020 RepID=D1A6E6_THECD|nr:glutamine amidotransferase class-II [Thermomonospora curvata DSM 43183]
MNRGRRGGVSTGMCGLFGLLRSPAAAHPEKASDAFVVLGMLAEERGDDSAGVALFTGRPVTRDAPVPLEAGDISVDGCRIVKGRGRFSRVWRPDLLLPLLDCAPVAIGHTRRATQGGRERLADAGPLAVPGPGAGIVGAHNGDVEAAALRERFALPRGRGGSDSEAILQALVGRREVAAVVEVLQALVGRAALAWVDRARPDRVHLARAALSPLVVAIDTEQNMYWASNPRWFREVRRCTSVEFASAVMLREGTYLEISCTPVPHISARAEFVPTARPCDLEEGVWEGFTAADRDRDRAELRHAVRKSGTGGFPALR